jgi:DNA end-binding protein Ku
MAVRAQWKGFIKVSLVSFPVSLYTATSSSDRISFNQIHKDTKQRIKLVPHEPDLGPVSREDLVKGYEYEKGKFVVVEPSELDAIKLETTNTIEIEKFVKESKIDEFYVDSPYFVAPDGPVADEPFRVFVEAMRRKKVAGIARVVLSGRERIVAVKPRGKGIIMQTLRYGSEVRSEEPYFEDVGTGKVDAQMLKLAEQLINQRLGEFDPSEFSDRYGEAVLALVKSKIAGQPIEVLEEEEPAAKVVSLMDALRQSVEEVEVKKKPAARSTTRRRAKKSSG